MKMTDGNNSFNVLVDIANLYETRWDGSVHTIHINPKELPTIMHFRCMLQDMFELSSNIILKVDSSVLHDFDSILVVHPNYSKSPISVFLDDFTQVQSSLRNVLLSSLQTVVNGMIMSKTIAKRFFGNVESENNCNTQQTVTMENAKEIESLSLNDDNNCLKKSRDLNDFVSNASIQTEVVNETSNKHNIISVDVKNVSSQEEKIGVKNSPKRNNRINRSFAVGQFLDYLKNVDVNGISNGHSNEEEAEETEFPLPKRKRVRRHRKRNNNEVFEPMSVSTPAADTNTSLEFNNETWKEGDGDAIPLLKRSVIFPDNK